MPTCNVITKPSTITTQVVLLLLAVTAVVTVTFTVNVTVTVAVKHYYCSYYHYADL